jgi:hypothetical protein
MTVDETRFVVAVRAGHCCEICGKRLPVGEGQLAHRIPQRKHLVGKYGAEVIHHPMNLKWTCSLECNAKASLGEHTAQIEELACEIAKEIWTETYVITQGQWNLTRPLLRSMMKAQEGTI